MRAIVYLILIFHEDVSNSSKVLSKSEKKQKKNCARCLHDFKFFDLTLCVSHDSTISSILTSDLGTVSLTIRLTDSIWNSPFLETC